jgi:branched-chain amino acid transport system ATP-binding protein
MAETVLEIAGLEVAYGGSRILQGIDLQVGSEPLSIVGRNGMGKTTLCQAILGLAPVTAGRIAFKGRDITGLKPNQIARHGIAYVPQGRRVFPSLRVDEHLRLAAGRRKGGRWSVEAIYALFPRLAERRRNGGSELSGGEQQMLAIGRALVLDPALIVMDEPTEGLAPVIVDKVVDVLAEVARSGVSVLLVEQNFSVATSVASRLLVMVNGLVALETTSSTMLADEELQRRYLGVSAHA